MKTEEPEMKTAYFLDGNLNVYTTPLHNRREALMFAGKHGYDFVGFLTAIEVLEVIAERENARDCGV